MAVPVPPRVPAEPSVSPGILDKPVATTGGELRQAICRACPIRLIGVRTQMRLKAALPESKTRPVSFSRYDTTLGGDIQPIQRLARCHAPIAAGLFTLMVRSRSMIRPPPAATCHSRALQVNDSAAFPCHTYPQKSFLPLARSPFWMRSAMLSSSTHVRGG